jgi:PAS domain S-box-containing protein
MEQIENFFIDKEYKEALDQTAIVSKADLNGNITYVNDNFCNITGYSKEELIGKPHSILKHEESNKETFKELWETILNKKVWKGELKNKKKDGSLYIVNATIIPQIDNNKIIGFIGIRYNTTELVEQRQLTQKILDAQKEIFILGNKKEGIKIVNKKFYKELGFISLAHYHSKCNDISDLILNINEIDNLKIERLKNFENVEINNIKIESMGKIKNYNLFLNSMNNNEYIITINDITKLSSLIEKAKNESFMKSNFLATMSHEIRTPLNGIIPYIDYLLDTNLTTEQKEKLEIINTSSHSLLRVINDILDFSKIESGKLEIEQTQFNPISEIESVVNLYAAKTFEKNIQFCAFIDPKLPNYLKGDILRIKQIVNNLLSNAIKFTPIGGEIDLNFELLNIIKNKAILEIYVKDNGIGISKENQKLMFKPFSQESSSITRTFGGTGLGLSISQQLAKMMNTKIHLESEVNQGSKFSFTIELDIVETCTLNEKDFNKNICIFIANQDYAKCMKVLTKYLNRFNIRYKIISDKNEILANDKIIFVISSGHDEIKWLNESFCDKKVISIIPSVELNSNNFYYNHIITMPLNGSKIFDTIVDDDAIKPLKKKLKSINDFYNAHVLVAEDNATNRNIVQLLLNKQKITVSFAENGIEAITFYEKNYKNIDLIFMDIHMPKMDGKDATKHIRNFEKDNNLKEIPIIALTADAIKEHQVEFLEIGMNKVLSKPIENEKFHQILREFLKELSVKNPSYSYIEIIKKELEIDSTMAEILLKSFRDDWKTIKIQLLEAFENKDTVKLKGLFHQLKGSSGGLKFIDIYDLCKKFELKSFDNEVINLNDFNNFIDKLDEI